MVNNCRVSNEKLIEEAAKAIYALDPDRQAWDGDAYGFLEPGAERGRKRAIAQARAALAVFEKAHTPTDDEREALVKRLEDEVEYRVRTAVALSKGGRAHNEQVVEGRASVRQIAAGFRRSVVPEPCPQPREHLSQHDAREGRTCAEHPCICPEPQGEPFDAQGVEFPFTHDGVTLEQDDGGFWVTIEHFRPYWVGPKALAALRAAGVGGAQ